MHLYNNHFHYSRLASVMSILERNRWVDPCNMAKQLRRAPPPTSSYMIVSPRIYDVLTVITDLQGLVTVPRMATYIMDMMVRRLLQ